MFFCPVLDFQDAYRSKDHSKMEILENILTKCQRIKHLVAGYDVPAAWFLESARCAISSVTLSGDSSTTLIDHI